MSLRSRFRLVLAVAAVSLVALAAGWISNERHHLLAEREAKAQALVDVASTVLEEFHTKEQQGVFSTPEAQRLALETLQKMRYDETNYFWVHSKNRMMVMHPYHPELNGKDLTNYRDPGGKAFFTEMAALVERQGSGFVAYQWPRPGQRDPVDKIAYVKGFDAWGWILGSGLYLDDVEADWRHDAFLASLLTLGCLGFLLIGSETASRSIFRRLDLMVGCFSAVAEGGSDAVRQLACREKASKRSKHPDEIDRLSKGFGDMLEEIEKRDQALARHQENLERVVETRTADLRTANVQLAAAQSDMNVFLGSIPSILIGMDPEGRITRWNASAAESFGLTRNHVVGKRLDQCGIKWLNRDMAEEVASWLKTGSLIQRDDLAYQRDGKVHFVGLTVRRIRSEGVHAGFIVTGTDITEKKSLEEQLRQAHKLEAVGQLAAGIAHEINTPAQFVADNTKFLKESWDAVVQIMDYCRKMQDEVREGGSVSVETLARYEELLRQSDVDFLTKEVPNAIDQSLEGLERVAKIVRAMKEFSHPGTSEKRAVDINKVIETTLAVARNEWRYVADVVTHFDAELPFVPCVASEINQVILNLVVNAAHAIAEANQGDNSHKGSITVTTSQAEDAAEIAVQDTGQGIPDGVQSRIFEPFFTTKAVGKGTGQGLALAHTIVVQKHQGKIWFKTQPGEGSTFFVRLPLHAQTAKTRG